MPLPKPPTPLQRTVFDIVKTHIQLPINRDYNALKRVLRDWLGYSNHTPLQDIPTFAAELVITVTRIAPAPLSPVAQRQGGISGSTLGPTRSTSSTRQWAPWGNRRSVKGASDSALIKKVTTAPSSASRSNPPFVYRKVVPLQVWTAVLPWEMQRGLSFSDLRLPTDVSSCCTGSRVATSSSKTAAETAERDRSSATVTATATELPAISDMAVQPPYLRQGESAENAQEEDPYGVVTSPIASFESSSANLTTAGARTPFGAAAATSSLSVAPPAPAMLFLSDMRSTKAYGIGFWSGAIRQAIDVLFVGPTLPSSIGRDSVSFQQLRQQDGLAMVTDNKISNTLLDRFFPLQEIRPPSSPSASCATFRVHSFGHLDPLPPSLHPSRLGIDDKKELYRGMSFTVAPDAPYNTSEEAPRYVFEVPRHTLRRAVAAALEESHSIHNDRLRATAARSDSLLKSSMDICDRGVTRSEPCQHEEDDVTIDLSVNLSEQLRADLFAKAQLCVEYVSLLEDAIAHYSRKLNTASGAAAEVPLDGTTPNHADVDSGSGGRMKVWLSEHEFRWMTPEQLRQASAADTTTEQQTCEISTMHTDDENFLQELGIKEGSTTPHVGNRDTPTAGAVAQTTQRNTTTSLSSQPNADRSVVVRPMETLTEAASAARSIRMQSPILQDEEEGRPRQLAPSFVGRHEAPTLQSSAVLLSADKLARYPRTHSHMPTLPPVDYELYELCMRLGVGQQSVLYHYHERIMHEWRRELHRRRRWRQQRQQEAGGEPEPSREKALSWLAEEDVQRMMALVRDRSLQLPYDMVSLVEAVCCDDLTQ
ncbi:hypothetical protein JKF63_05463 [Porcisia hertigi]|uniref:Uncharacterized protein n=1 Tax=Porcisia hertigi TaxID=2761500 RepID=A0A836LF57_9TRYP|nr:hypothetical protein JKF63_05463 [Porcisia hertigi]